MLEALEDVIRLATDEVIHVAHEGAGLIVKTLEVLRRLEVDLVPLSVIIIRYIVYVH